MKIKSIIISSIFFALATLPAHARNTTSLTTPSGEFKIEFFAQKSEMARPTLIILSGTKGFASPAYDAIANKFLDAGMDVYLIHVLSKDDMDQIANFPDAKSRIAYYKQQRPRWIEAVRMLASQLRKIGHPVGLLGVYLGAETAGIALSQGVPVDAALLVDGAPPATTEWPASQSPPIKLIWGSNDTVYPLSSGRSFVNRVKQAGGAADITVFQRQKHDFFLEPESQQANKAYETAVEFMKSKLQAN